MKYISNLSLSRPLGLGTIEPNFLYAVPLELEDGTREFDQMAMRYSFGTIRLAIYSDLDGYPDALLLDVGSPSQYDTNGLALYDFSSNLTLQNGRFWMVCLSDSSTSTNSLSSMEGNLSISTLGWDLSTNNYITGYKYQFDFGSSFPLAFPAGATVLTSMDFLPFVAVREVSFVPGTIGGGGSGVSGISGYSGFSGISGHSGKSGFSGISGHSGKSGFSGTSGYSGGSGISGFSGVSGYSGIDGIIGASGFSGYSGTSGYSGYSGTSGYSGYSGVSGFSGDSGISGFSGTSGFSGISGYSGFSGSSGTSGFSGMSGLSGYSGYSGESGFSGISGYSGASGYSGFSGTSGYSGIFNGTQGSVLFVGAGGTTAEDNANLFWDDSNDRLQIGGNAPTARFQLPAGTAVANTAPLKLTSGTNLFTPEAGAIEWDGSRLYATQTSGPTRKTLAYTDDSAFTSSFGITLDGGGGVISTGLKGFVSIPYNCTITEWTLLADQSGSIVIDVWKDAYANYQPTVADTITGTEKPTLSSQIKNQDSNLTTWTTAVSAGDVLAFNVDSSSVVTRVHLIIKVIKI